MKHLSLFLLTICLLSSFSLTTYAETYSFEADAELILAQIKEAYARHENTKKEHYLEPFLFPNLVNHEETINNVYSFNKNTNLALSQSISDFVEKHICKTPSGGKICTAFKKRIKNLDYNKDLNLDDSLFFNSNFIVGYKDFFVDSWTSYYQSTFFLNLEHITPHGLLRKIIHEMYQTVDLKNSTLHTLFIIKKKHLSLPICDVISLNYNIEFRMASSALRALKIEDLIVSEIVGHQLYTLVDPSFNCEKSLRWMNTYTEIIAAKLRKKKYFESFTNIPTQCWVRLKPAQTFIEALALMNPLDVVSYSEDAKPLCNFLTENDLDDLLNDYEVPTWTDVSHQGPRPRVGNP